MTAIAQSSGSAMGIILPPLVAWLIIGYGWRVSYLILGVVVFIIVLTSAQFIKREPSEIGLLPYGENETISGKGVPKEKGLSFREAICTSQFWILGIIYLCFGIFLNVVQVHFVPHITDLGFPATVAATMLAVRAIISIPGRFGLGVLADRIGNKKVITFCFALATFTLLLFAVADEVGILYLVVILHSIATAGILLMMSLIIAELFGLTSLGVIMGAITLIWSFGSATGPIVAGYIFDNFGNYKWAFLISAIASTVALILCLVLRPLQKMKGLK